MKKDWKSTYGIGHILVTVKCLLIYPNPESALDEEAGKLLLEEYESYCARAKLITSVHATPRTKPAEFDETKEEEAPSTASRPPSMVVPDVPKLTVSPKSGAQSTVPIPSRPLGSDASNLPAEKQFTVSKERRTSPAPLGTADANVATKNVVTTGAAAKTTKRAATSSAGTEKRKKALKRL